LQLDAGRSPNILSYLITKSRKYENTKEGWKVRFYLFRHFVLSCFRSFSAKDIWFQAAVDLARLDAVFEPDVFSVLITKDRKCENTKTVGRGFALKIRARFA
jgi:hypothetical protein